MQVSEGTRVIPGIRMKTFVENAKQRLLSIEPYRPGKPIAEVKRELKLRHVVKLASNETPYGPSKKVLAALRRESVSINRYPDGGCFYLRQALAKRLGVAGNQLIFGNGSDEIIVMTIRAFVGEGEEVVVARPSFLIYEIAARIEGAVVKSVPLKGFHYDLEGMAAAVTPKTKLVFIGNPDNPAGTYVSARQLEEFLKTIRPDIGVFVDEAYFEYVNTGDYPDTVKLLSRYGNLIITRTFSKIYGLAGLRIGYGIARPEVVDILNRVREPFNVDSLAQAAALACLKDGAYYRRIARETEKEKQGLYRALDKLGRPFVKSATNFVLVDVGQGTPVAEKLLRKGVIVRDMKFWGLENFIRVTIGKKEENRKFIKALLEVASSQK